MGSSDESYILHIGSKVKYTWIQVKLSRTYVLFIYYITSLLRDHKLQKQMTSIKELKDTKKLYHPTISYPKALQDTCIQAKYSSLETLNAMTQNRQCDPHDLEDPHMMHLISLEDSGTSRSSADQPTQNRTNIHSRQGLNTTQLSVYSRMNTWPGCRRAFCTTDHILELNFQLNQAKPKKKQVY